MLPVCGLATVLWLQSCRNHLGSKCRHFFCADAFSLTLHNPELQKLQAGSLSILTAKNTNGKLRTVPPTARRCIRCQKQEEVNEQKAGAGHGAASSSPPQSNRRRTLRKKFSSNSCSSDFQCLQNSALRSHQPKLRTRATGIKSRERHVINNMNKWTQRVTCSRSSQQGLKLTRSK